MTSCPECGTQNPAEAARFCSRCGALLPRPVEERPARPQASAGRRRWAAVAVVAVVVALGAVATMAWLDRPTPTLWQRTVPTPVPIPDPAVVAVGPDHVLVGSRVVPTRPGAPPTVLRQLPASLAESALDGGRWAVVEGGALVTGTVVDGVVDRTRLPTGPAIGGTARAWADGDPVFTGEDGHLVRLGPGGAVVWWTQWAVPSLFATGEQWLLGEDAGGGAIAIAVRDGTRTRLVGRPLAVVGDVAVLRRDAVVVGVDLATGTQRWERSGGGGVWRVVAGQLVLEGATRVVRVDPATGDTTGEVVGAAGVAVDDGVVTSRDDELVAMDWRGSVAWSRPLGTGSDDRLLAVDATRVAVRSRTEAGVTVTVVDATGGATLAATTPLPAPLQPPAAAGDVVGIPLPRMAAPLVLDAATGARLDVVTPPLRRDRIETDAGPQVVDAGAASVRAVGPLGVWRALLDAPLATAPMPLAASVDVTTADGVVQRLDPTDGTARWRTHLDASLTALAATPAEVFVGTADGRIVVLDGVGRVVRTIRVGPAVVAIAAGDGGLVAVSADGTIRGYVR